MCGRLTQSLTADQLAILFDATPLIAESSERYNVAPTQPLLAITEQDDRRIVTSFRWGLIPPWAKDAQIGARLINARAETLAEKPSFRTAFRHQRCIVPAGAFYEWKTVGHAKVPYAVLRRDEQPLAFAGLWSTWRNPATDEPLRTCTIVTTTPNELLAPIHDRMPAILPKPTWDAWLDPAFDNLDALQSMLAPYPAEELQAYPVSNLVNRVQNDGRELLEPASSR